MVDPAKTALENQDYRVEYRVRPVTRYQVTRYHESGGGRTGGTEQKGEYDSPDVAYEVAEALCKDEHRRLGYPPGDERIKYPEHPKATAAVKVGLAGQALEPSDFLGANTGNWDSRSR